MGNLFFCKVQLYIWQRIQSVFVLESLEQRLANIAQYPLCNDLRRKAEFLFLLSYNVSCERCSAALLYIVVGRIQDKRKKNRRNGNKSPLCPLAMF